jgi:U32 family peptidase
MGLDIDPPSEHCHADPELLAPAGDPASLRAAIETGADAVYFGLKVLNARRRARNFTPEELREAVALLHDRGARAYLTLNIDLTERDLVTAAGVLELARQAGADAVLVRDPALLSLREHYPELEFHFSTQTCMTSAADVAAAAELGADRVVLARELSLEEIAAAAAVEGIGTEVFVQGALCFSVSGRCLMSSWVGGRSGNRGACTSPCRVPWSVEGEPAGTPLSMHDLAAAGRLGELRRAGVAALKIEGRMKNADWVRRAVQLYRRALDGEDPAALRDEIEALGAYTGRRMTSGYLDAAREEMTGVAGRESSDRTRGEAPPGDGTSVDETSAEETGPGATYSMRMLVEPRGIMCRCVYRGVVDEWTIPKTVVRRPHKAVSIGALLEFLVEQPVQGCRADGPETNEPAFLLVPRAVNALTSRISKTIQRGRKRRDGLAEVELPEAVRELLRPGPHCPANRTPLGDEPDRVRLDAEMVGPFLAAVQPGGVIVEGLAAEDVRRVKAACSPAQLTAALPPVFFDEDLPRLKALVERCKRSGVTVEVNSWGGWHLARQAGARIESGPGLPVLNSLAARALARRGVEAVTLSPEAGRHQLADVAANCPLPCSLLVFGRPRLMISRAEPPPELLGCVLADRRDTRVTSGREGGLWVLRPVEPFDLRDLRNDRLRVKHLVVDLTGSPNPLRDWTRRPKRRESPHRFNYERGLL